MTKIRRDIKIVYVISREVRRIDKHINKPTKTSQTTHPHKNVHNTRSVFKNDYFDYFQKSVFLDKTLIMYMYVQRILKSTKK